MKPVESHQRIEDLESENRRLRQEVTRLQREQDRLRREREGLEKERDGLKKELELAWRAARRQAAPFSKGEPKTCPQRPGRKAGKEYGRQGYRPVPDRIDEEIEVPLPAYCPDCGGDTESVRWADQYQAEILRETRVTRFRIEVGCCRQCGRRVQGRHRRQTSDALGAAASQLGPEAVALATVLNKELGLPYGKTAAVLQQGFGLQVTRGAVSHATARVATRCEPSYRQLVETVRSSPAVTADETGWRVAGRLWWLWVAATDEATVYGIYPGRGFTEAARLLGADYSGILIHDGWSVYNLFARAFHQSCQQHLIRRCSETAQQQSATAATFPLAVKEILQQGLRLRDRYAEGEISTHGLAVAAGRLQARLQKWLRRRWRTEQNRRLTNHLTHHFPWLFSYLHCPGLEATNWRAEQALRPAVVARKVWGGNRSRAGAHSQQVLMSVLRTCRQQGEQPIPLLAGLLRSPIVEPLDFSSN